MNKTFNSFDEAAVAIKNAGWTLELPDSCNYFYRVYAKPGDDQVLCPMIQSMRVFDRDLGEYTDSVETTYL